MAYHHTTVLDNQIKALPTVGTASGSIATFDTDLTENLVEVKCQIVATQSGSGTPSPSNPRPITVYTSLNLSHSGSDTSNPNVTNIPFGQNVANGVLNVGSGVLTITHGYSLLSNLNWSAVGDRFYADPSNILKADGITTNSSHYAPIANIAGGGAPMSDLSICAINRGTNDRLYIKDTRFSDVNTFVSTMGSVQIIYELATPIEIQLDSTQITALLNENNIWCDTGDTEVKYILSVGKKIS